MQPFVHARASSAGTERSWRDDLPIHEFMDLAKHACPDLRHRLVLHNADLGPELAARAFPHRADAREIARSHVRQDLGWLPPLSAWLGQCDADKLPRARAEAPSLAETAAAAADHLGLEDETPVRRVCDLLTLPIQFAPDHRRVAARLLMSSLGPILARAVLGAPAPFRGRGGRPVVVDFAWIAEGLIVAHVGAIYSLERVLGCFHGREPLAPPAAVAVRP